MKTWIFAFLILALCSCATAPFPGSDEYREDIDASSAGDKRFSGLYDNFEFRATLLNKKTLRKINERETLVYGWSAETSSDELQKKMTKAATETKIFVSFFTPRAADDNLDKSSSIWKIYLHAGGRRFEGKARKDSTNLKEIMSIFPYHTRWATAYSFEFPMSTDEVESGPVRLEITGPLGQREVSFL